MSPRRSSAGGELPVVADRDQARLQQLGYKQELKRGLSRRDDDLQHRPALRRAGVHDAGLARRGALQRLRRAVHGGDLLGVPDHRRPLLLERQARRQGLGSACLLGHRMWACTTSVDFSLAQFIQVIVLLSTGGANGGGYLASKYVVLAIYCVILILHGLINSLSINWLAFFGQLGAFWNLAGVFVLTVLIPVVAKDRASMEFMFTNCYTDDTVGIHSKVYILAIGLLTSQYSLLGYDTSAHMSEETKNAEWSGPMGIVVSVALSSVFGWIYLVALTSMVTDIPSLLDPTNDAGGNAIAQALYTTFRQRFGSGGGGVICLAAMAVSIFLCGTASVTSNSRMGYAFSRDGAMPLSRLWYRVNKHESLGSQVAFQAMVSITTLGMYIAYALPIFFRVTTARNSFVPGPFHLGRRCSLVVGWVAVLWVALVTVLFCLPVAYPVAGINFNYTPVAVGGVLLLSLGAWVLHARFWFRGPITTVDT